MILRLCNDVPVQNCASLDSVVLNIQVRMLPGKAASLHREAINFIKNDSLRLVYVKMCIFKKDPRLLGVERLVVMQ